MVRDNPERESGDVPLWVCDAYVCQTGLGLLTGEDDE